MIVKELMPQQSEELLNKLKTRFDKNKIRHKDIDWNNVVARLKSNPEKLWSLQQMEQTEGEPNLIGFDEKTNEYNFYDCSAESPKGRRSLCYDNKALESRKTHKPRNSAMGMAQEMGIELLTELEYRDLQKHGPFDSKTSSWLKTPENIRILGGGIFGDFRFGTVFIYHNGVESYYGGRGFRGSLRV